MELIAALTTLSSVRYVAPGISKLTFGHYKASGERSLKVKALKPIKICPQITWTPIWTCTVDVFHSK